MVLLSSLLAFTGMSVLTAPSEIAFNEARPVWLHGRETEMNVFAGFRALVEAQTDTPMTVRATASTLYRLFVNGVFVGHGPARGPHGYYRVDEWNISPWLRAGTNVVAIEVAGYNANSYYVLDQPSFLQAEILSGDTVHAATGSEHTPFPGAALPERVQKVQRYSFQRPFIEVWRLAPGYDAWRSDPLCPLKEDRVAITNEKLLLPRGVPYPEFTIQGATQHVSTGTFAQGKPGQPFRDRSLTNIGPKLKGYTMDDLEVIVSKIMEETETQDITRVDGESVTDAIPPLKEGTFSILDLGTNLSGFPRFQVTCDEPVRLLLSYDEMLSEGDVNWRRLGCVNALLFDLAPGVYDIEGFEPHTMRYMKFMTLSGTCTLSNIGLRRYEHPGAVKAQFTSASDALNRIFEAGRTTFAQNAVDIYMDCPHRERAGWLCDSFFMARAELALSGQIEVEHNFIENYLLPERFECLPEGMLPMCYPADHYDGVFIPNWALWFVIQLGEFAERNNDPALIRAAKPRVEALFNYFQGFENEDGLLEKLESWVFIEWSAANNFTQDVNYPSNMLYAAALDTAGRLFDENAWSAKALALRARIREQAHTGLFFVDNGQRKEGELLATDNMTEVCQYFAFYFGVATPETDGELWRILLDEFGPDRQKRGDYPKIHAANAFIGTMLRFELLSRAGRADQLLREVEDYLMYMVERTGTLWENIQDHASLNHGFASHIVVTLFRDILGAWNIDAGEKKVHIRLTDIPLPWCAGELPVGDHTITLQWKRDAETIQLYVAVPSEFTVTVENLTDKTITQVDQKLF